MPRSARGYSVGVRYAVIIPVYNERDLLPRLLERVVRTPPPDLPDSDPPAAAAGAGGADAAPDETPVPEPATMERTIILIDDGSTDGTREFIEKQQGRAGFEVIVQPRNAGKGAAVRAGFARALDLRCDAAIIQDADLEYDPADHAAILQPILDGRADVVIGSRFIGGTHRVLYYWHYAANRAITTLSNIFTNLNLTDIECCLKAFTREVLERIEVREDRFGVEPELVARVARLHLPEHAGVRATRVFEVPVSYAGRTYAEGKKVTWRDGVSAVRCILKYNLFA